MDLDGQPGQHRREARVNAAVRFAAAYAALTASHKFADHWIQVDAQATAKGDPGTAGRLACASHIATYTVTQGLALLAADRLLGLRLSPGRTAAALAVSAGTHYAADRQAGHWRDEAPRGVARLATATGHGHGWRLTPSGSGICHAPRFSPTCAQPVGLLRRRV